MTRMPRSNQPKPNMGGPTWTFGKLRPRSHTILKPRYLLQVSYGLGVEIGLSVRLAIRRLKAPFRSFTLWNFLLNVKGYQALHRKVNSTNSSPVNKGVRVLLALLIVFSTQLPTRVGGYLEITTTETLRDSALMVLERPSMD